MTKEQPSASFDISAEEIFESAGHQINQVDLDRICRQIENDEVLWKALDDAKNQAIRDVLGPRFHR